MDVRPDPALCDALRAARHVLVLTGSGVSAESGIPTFRDAQTGVWAQFRPEELATPEAFRRNPERVLGWYRWRRELVAAAEPNAAHRALAQLSGRVPRLTLVTQNVDGLHQRAGSRGVIEFHGNLTRDRCSDGCGHAQPAADATAAACPRCGAALRPDVVWFGEAIPPDALHRSTEAAGDCDLMLSIGTSSLVYPAAGLAELALRAGAVLVEINTASTPLSSLADHALRGPASAWVPALLAGTPAR